MDGYDPVEPARQSFALPWDDIPAFMRAYFFKDVYQECLQGNSSYLLIQRYNGKNFTIYHYTADVSAPENYSLNTDEPVLQIIYAQQGHMAWRLEDAHVYHADQGAFTLQSSPSPSFTLRFVGPGVYRVFILRFNRLFLSRLYLEIPALASLDHNLNNRFQYTMGPQKHFFSVSPDMINLAEKMLNIDLEPPFRRREISFLSADFLLHALAVLSKFSYVAEDEREKFLQAGDLLMQDDSIHDEKELSDKTGIPRKVLRRGFKQMYGKSVQQWIQEFQQKGTGCRNF